MQSLSSRINYAARVIREGRPTSRKFDSCFEMGDGNLVVDALVSRSGEGSPLLTKNIGKYISKNSIEASRAKLLSPTKVKS